MLLSAMGCSATGGDSAPASSSVSDSALGAQDVSSDSEATLPTSESGPPPEPPHDRTVRIEADLTTGGNVGWIVQTVLVNDAVEGGVNDGHFRYLQRWTGFEWEDVAIIPFYGNQGSTPIACEPEEPTECSSAMSEPDQPAPGESGQQRTASLKSVPSGIYRVAEFGVGIERHTATPTVVSDNITVA